MTPSITLRASTDNDRDFVDKLTRIVMMPYVAQIWQSEQDREVYFSLNSFDLETTKIIQYQLEDAGRLSVSRTPGYIKIDNIHLLPAYQGKGIGRFVMQNIIAESEQSGLPLLLNVLECNPAKNLYQSLGFEIVALEDHRFSMKRPAV